MTRRVFIILLLAAASCCVSRSASAQGGPPFEDPYPAGSGTGTSAPFPSTGEPAFPTTGFPTTPFPTTGFPAAGQPALGGYDAGVAGSYGPAATPVATPARRFEPAETMALVGDQYILRGDLLGDANLMMSSMFAQASKLPAEQQEQARRELLEYREQLIEMKLLREAIDRKLKYLAFLRPLPSLPDPKKAAERSDKIRESVAKEFDKQLAEMQTDIRKASPEEQQNLARKSPTMYLVAVTMKDNGITSREDPGLEKVLVQHGTSLAKQQQAFMEWLLGQSAVSSAIDRPEITHEQMVAYYREHQDEFSMPTRAKWEQLSVHFNRIRDFKAAWAEIASMGNEVLGGAPFSAVAQRRSHEKLASRGGFHDWAPYGDLTISRPIHQAIFEIEPNRLSQIIQDDEGLHIVRVLERQDAHVQNFQEVQDDIKEKLTNEHLNKSYNDFVKKLREETPVVTDFAEQEAADRYARPSPPGGLSR